MLGVSQTSSARTIKWDCARVVSITSNYVTYSNQEYWLRVQLKYTNDRPLRRQTLRAKLLCAQIYQLKIYARSYVCVCACACWLVSSKANLGYLFSKYKSLLPYKYVLHIHCHGLLSTVCQLWSNNIFHSWIYRFMKMKTLDIRVP